MSTKPVKKRIRLSTRHWKSEEISKILNYMFDLKIGGKEPGHPTANKYYQKVIDQLKIPLCSVNQIKTKIANMKKKYSLAIQWANQTGQGVADGSILDHQRKMCDFFDLLEKIYGEKKSFRVPFMYCNLRIDQSQDTSVRKESGNVEQSNDRHPNPNNSNIEQSKGFKNNDNQTGRNAAAVIGDALTNRARVLDDRNQHEFELRRQELEFEREKFEFEKQMRRKEMDFRQRMQLEKLRQEERLAKLRLEYEFNRRE